jgi:(E)-4-hydroxy-3-methylbut-2-enyl-diphosphate synthase
MNDDIKIPVIIRRRYDDVDLEDLQIKAAADLGQFFIDGFGDGVWVDAPNLPQSEVTSLMFSILQGARVRFSKTEYISCPGCGRTLYDLEATIARIKKRTSHLKGLKIGVMGCIVNGPGEMADADYGYVGSARGMVNLYKGQNCIEKLIPEADAVERLVQLIKDNGDWRDA